MKTSNLLGLGLAILGNGVALAAGRPVKPARAQRAKACVITLQVLPGSDGGPLGPDGKHHDAFVPSNLEVPVGKIVTVRIVNHDMMEHSIYQPELGLDIVARPAAMKPDGRMIPITTTATFSVKARGRYRWYCTKPCDDDAKGWAMAPAARGTRDAGRPDKDGFMAGEIVAF